ncbi:hypothetical protein GCM10010260_30050 [Streptomyces filipinensis]|uniref:Uncharacterized protein n=1 Tax=Streptomyces filipinensis TaxID=66887 RepID=A0A918IBS7_9ACTN|nr:hypothetical protein GCM10010260_30050 [Streptomyces filipinensis]
MSRNTDRAFRALGVEHHQARVRLLPHLPAQQVMDGLPSSRPLVNYVTAPRGGAGMCEGWQGIRGEGGGLTSLSVPPVDVKSLLGVRR